MISIVTKLPTWLFSVRFVLDLILIITMYYLTWLMFSFITITCCYLLSFACYYLLTLHSLVVVATVLLHYIFNPRLPEYQFVIGLIIRNSIQRKVLLSVTLTIRNIRGRFCRRLNHQRIDPKKCTLIKF